MRGKTATIVVFPPVPLQEAYDDLGRRQSVDQDGVQLRGSATPPRRMYRGEPVVTDLDAVVFLPASQRVDGDDVSVLTLLVDGAWVEVIESRSPVNLGSYKISGWSGGLRVVRIDLVRIDRRDGSHGQL